MAPMRSPLLRVVALALLAAAPAARAGTRCQDPSVALADARGLAAVRGLVGRACPCDAFDGSTPAKGRAAYVRCAKAVVVDASDGTPVLGFSLRRECRRAAVDFQARSTCGFTPAADRVVCCEVKPASGRTKAKIEPATRCASGPSGAIVRTACRASAFTDVCSGDTTDNHCTTLLAQTTVDVPSAAQPAHTPGSPGVVPSAKLVTQYDAGVNLDRARYTRWRLAGPERQPDAILVLVPGFEGGAGDFRILAEHLIGRGLADGRVLELWGVDRRTNQLEDTAGLDVAEEFLSADVALDWLYGAELSLPLSPALARRAQFYDAQADTAFMAEWTNLVFSRDIDAVVAQARTVARNQNVFLGGHSAGTGFAARYAATDFNLTGEGAADPGYARLRGLVLLEGGGGSTTYAAPLTDDTLNRIEDKADGGLYGAVQSNAGRCADGTTACTVATEDVDCDGIGEGTCTPATTAYSVVPGLLNPRILASAEPSAIQGVLDPNGGQIVITVDQNGVPGNNAVAKVADLATLAVLGKGTVYGGLGSFLDDDGVVASIASFVATSVGAPGPTVGGLLTWLPVGGPTPMPASVLPYNGPPPTTLPGTKWGQEHEVTRFDRMLDVFYKGRTNFTDWYYPNAGPSTTSVTGVCTAGTCTVGNVGAACSAAADCTQSVNLDSTALSIGRGRPDIENLTQAASIDIPVFAAGGSNGLTPVPGSYTAFASSIGPCTAPSCSGAPRVVSDAVPNPAFPTFGDVAGGFEVHVAEGFAHVDVLTAEDDALNPIPSALYDFIARNAP